MEGEDAEMLEPLVSMRDWWGVVEGTPLLSRDLTIEALCLDRKDAAAAAPAFDDAEVLDVVW